MGLFSKKNKESTGVAEQISVSESTVESRVEKENTADEELIAVISAAIAAYESESFVQTLSIRKINRTAGVKPAWGTAGLNEAIDAGRF